jgi:ZIP family zinc transporter
MTDWVQVSLLTLMAGIMMPVGAVLASVERIQPRWLETEFRHAVIAFGGGALLAAVALVLIPEGIKDLSVMAVCLWFAGGGLTFMLLDILLAAKGTSASQLAAMLADFIPEAMAMGATFTVSPDAGLLLALIIALQNLPEGFNAYRELAESTRNRPVYLVVAFVFMALLGPLAGLTGHFFLAEYKTLIAGIMVFAAGGILYLIFQDIAPQARLKNHYAPPLAALGGFLLGLIGHMQLTP